MLHHPRVLTFTHSFEPGGVEKVALRLVETWTSAGIAVRTIVGRGVGTAPAGLSACDVVILDRRGWTGRFETLWMIARLPGEVRRYRPEVVFCAGNTYAVVALALKLLSFGSCPPLVCKVSNDLARLDQGAASRWFYRAWLRLQGRSIGHFIGMAAPMRDEITQAMGVPDARVSIIDDPALAAADVARLGAAQRRGGLVGRGRRFIGIGRLVPQKNFALMIRAFADIAQPSDRLAILGDGPERARLKRLVAALGLIDRVDLPGHADPVETWLGDSDVFVLSSDYEGVPAVIVEALAAGLPIVATDCSVSMSSLLDGGRLGTLVEAGDRAALASAMDRAMATGSSPAAARAKALCFTTERGAPRYVQIFADMVRRPMRVSLPETVSVGTPIPTGP